MLINFAFFSNIAVPLITGSFFLLYFVYFIIANPSKMISYKIFIAFLIAFGFFLLGRPLQLISGPHPLPLIIVNIRMFIFCSVVSPLIIFMSNNVKRTVIKHKEIIIGICVMLGLIYVVFNTFGTKDSYIVFKENGITAYDSLTPSMLPPFYSREVTVGVQAVTGFLLFIFSFYRLVRLKFETSFADFLRDKNFFINTGIVIFAVSFVVGSLAKQWWLFYISSSFTALFVGVSVVMDIKESHIYYEKLIPFLKEDIIHNFAFSDFSTVKIKEMLRLLGKKTMMDTFIVLKLTDIQNDLTDGLLKFDAVINVLSRNLSEVIDDENFVLLPISNGRIGIVMNLLAVKNRNFHLLEILENIHIEINERQKCNLKIGIGRSYKNIDDLRISYSEALNALNFAEKLEGSDIIHVENISEINAHNNNYPVQEKERLLSLIKLGDVTNSMGSLKEFIVKFRIFIEEKPDILKVRLYELVGSLIDSAILGGGDEKRLNDLVIKYFDDINLIRDLNTAEKWLTTIVAEIAGNIGNVYEKRSKTLIENAKKYIDRNYKSQLSYKDVAKEIFISPSYFLNLFKKESGLTFVEYLTNVRVNKAKELLKLTELNITEIAYEIGFNNSNYFSNIFKKTVGISAKEYRKNP
jgi:two-component system, response regulator YesN